MKHQLGAGEFKAHCLALLDQVEQSRKEIVITKRGRPVARLVPIDSAAPSVFGNLSGSAHISGDIVGPTGEEWTVDASE